MGHLERVEMENWNGQNENCLLSNTYLSKKTTCKTRPIELQYAVQCMTVLVRDCKIYSMASTTAVCFWYFLIIDWVM